MPTYAEVTKTIEDRFTQLWTLTQVAHQNVPALNYSGPTKPPLAEGADPYISTKILYGDTQNLEVGSTAARRTFGSLSVECYMPKDTGSVANQNALDALVSLFEFQKISGIVFRELVSMNDVTQSGWFVTPSLIRFHFDR